MKSQQICLKNRPEGQVILENFQSHIVDIPQPEEGDMLVETLYLSIDPYMRGRMNETKSYIPPFQIGDPLQGGVIVRVKHSNNGKYPVGATLAGMGLWSDFFITDGEGFSQIDGNIAPLSYYLGLMGMPGITAYVGLTTIANLQAGENVFVSAACGAVGQVVGQIAKNNGCRIVGSAGSDEKCAYLIEELGFDDAINYKTCPNLPKSISQSMPSGIDVHFENVGGPILEAVIANLNFKARIALCGYISAYNVPYSDLPAGPRNMALMIGRSVRMEGFIVSNYPKEAPKWIKQASKWLKQDKLKYRETISQGLDLAPQAFIDMLQGKNFGKQIVKLTD